MTAPRRIVPLTPADPPEAPVTAPITPLLWGWPQIVEATNVPRRTLEREISAGRFPKPVRHVGRRPYWLPSDVIAWAKGGGR
jgi:predicted DNA-binding transcriptional regulator AlpA